MDKRCRCDRVEVAIPVQLRQRFKPCCPVFAVLEDCADCSNCSSCGGGGEEEIWLRRTFKYLHDAASRTLAAYVNPHNRTAASVVSIDNNNSHFATTANILSAFQLTDRAAYGIIRHSCLHRCRTLYSLSL